MQSEIVAYKIETVLPAWGTRTKNYKCYHTTNAESMHKTKDPLLSEKARSNEHIKRNIANICTVSKSGEKVPVIVKVPDSIVTSVAKRTAYHPENIIVSHAEMHISPKIYQRASRNKNITQKLVKIKQNCPTKLDQHVLSGLAQ